MYFVLLDAKAYPCAADGRGGIIPRALEVLFDKLEQMEVAAPGSTTAAISYIEIYNEKIHDLLQPFKLDVKQTFKVWRGLCYTAC